MFGWGFTSLFVRYVSGCIMSCSDVDGCNSAVRVLGDALAFILTILVIEMYRNKV